MRWMLILCVVLLGGTVSAQNSPPTVTVTSLGVQVPNSGGINVLPNSTFNSAGIRYDVDDPDGNPVSCTAVVSNIGAAVNWTEANFNVPSTNTPWQQDITAALGEFGGDGTVHVVTLTFNDGMADTIFSFTINVTSGTSGGGSSTPGSDGGSCTTGSPALPWVLAIALTGAAWLRRRRLA
jgi:hypothetical protein